MRRWTDLGRAASHVLPVSVFVLVSASLVYGAWNVGWLGIDAQIYHRGSAAWLAGQSPWEAMRTLNGATGHYAGLPFTVVVLAPFTLLPEPTFVVAAIAVSAAAGIYAVRALHLPWYYVLFPPLVASVLSGNPSSFAIALLVTSRPPLQGLAPLVKIYAVIPLALRFRWRAIAWTLVLAIPTLIALPLWFEYVTRFPEITARLVFEAEDGYSASRMGLPVEIMALLVIGILWLRDREAGAWMAVPSAWPATQYHYATLALPLLRTRWWLAIFLALAPGGFVWVGAVLLLVESVLRRRLVARPGQEATVTQ